MGTVFDPDQECCSGFPEDSWTTFTNSSPVQDALSEERTCSMRSLLLAFSLAATTGMSFAASTTARVEQGILQGTKEAGLTVYKGIPFAAPPVGDLRWRAPQPASAWQGIRLADKFAPQCVQGGSGPDGKAPAMSEDCLYLNVWSPARSASGRVPVLVWIYGGGFNAGATSVPVYSGEVLARKGVVLVSIAYRVGALGFLAHPELSAESPQHVSGNYGLLDMIAGLQWIQKNIAAFGGDPNKVTIFGESAGGIAVSQLCASPLAKGLFQGAISESGGSFGPPRPSGGPGENMRLLATAERDGQAFAVGAGADSLAELRLADCRRVGHSKRSILALRRQEIQRHSHSHRLQLGRRRKLLSRPLAAGLYRRRAQALRTLCGQSAQGLSSRRKGRAQDRA
jgi:para-nitrobenzyl esterase